MDQYHRRKLDKYCDMLVPKINLERLLPKLISNGVYNKDDVNMDRWKKQLDDLQTVKDVYLTIKTRGPDAFRNLLLSLRQSGHEDLARILSEKTDITPNNNTECNSSNTNNCNNTMLKKDVRRKTEEYFTQNNEVTNDNYYTIMQTSENLLNIVVRKATEFRDGPIIGQIERYPMRSNPRGKVLIINNIEFVNIPHRRGSAVDELHLKELFSEMGFHVTIYQNLTGKEMKQTFKKFSQNNGFESVHSFFAIVCSHGSQVVKKDYYCTEIQCIDWEEPGYETVTDTDIMNNFTTKNCLALAGKPKVFIFQTCRGMKKQNSMCRNTTDGYDRKIIASSERAETSSSNHFSEQDIAMKVRNYSDTLVAYATVPGYVSFRDTVTGRFTQFGNYQNYGDTRKNSVSNEIQNMSLRQFENLEKAGKLMFLDQGNQGKVRDIFIRIWELYCLGSF